MEANILKVILIFIELYTLLYLIKQKKIIDIYNTMKQLFIKTFNYTLNLLSYLFLITFYSSLILGKCFSSNLSVKSVFVNRLVSWLYIIVPFLFLAISIGIWMKKIFNEANIYLKERIIINNDFVSCVLKLNLLIIFFLFQAIVLTPIFIYSLTDLLA